MIRREGFMMLAESGHAICENLANMTWPRPSLSDKENDKGDNQRIQRDGFRQREAKDGQAEHAVA